MRKSIAVWGDEEILQILLVSLEVLTALFRAHILIWGAPNAPFDRRALGRLRKNWLPLCHTMPAVLSFPPVLPDGIGGEADSEPADPEWIFDLGRWFLKGDRVARGRLIAALSRSDFSWEGGIQPEVST